MLMMLDLVGRAHPLVLHIPIGVLIYTYMHWVYTFVKGKKVAKTDFTIPLLIALLGTIISCPGIRTWELELRLPRLFFLFFINQILTRKYLGCIFHL